MWTVGATAKAVHPFPNNSRDYWKIKPPERLSKRKVFTVAFLTLVRYKFGLGVLDVFAFARIVSPSVRVKPAMFTLSDFRIGMFFVTARFSVFQ